MPPSHANAWTSGIQKGIQIGDRAPFLLAVMCCSIWLATQKLVSPALQDAMLVLGLWAMAATMTWGIAGYRVWAALPKRVTTDFQQKHARWEVKTYRTKPSSNTSATLFRAFVSLGLTLPFLLPMFYVLLQLSPVVGAGAAVILLIMALPLWLYW